MTTSTHRVPAAPEFFSKDVTEARRFYLNLNPPRSKPLAVVCGGLEKCTPDYAIHRATVPFYTVEYVIHGRGRLKLDGHSHALLPGRVYCYSPGMRHDITADPADPLIKYFVSFAGTQAGKLLTSARLVPGQVLQMQPPHEAQSLFDELVHCGVRNTRHSSDLCAHLLQCLLLKVSETRAPLEAKEARAFTTYQLCRQHMQAHFLRLKTLDQVAQECHVNAAYLCRLFRRYDHQSPYQYLQRLKMNAAAQLLQQDNALVKQVAQQIGFADAFHFSRAFKCAFGLPPDAFRKLR